METRKLYIQGKSTVLVIPSKFLRALKWEPQDDVTITLLPNNSLNLSKVVVQPSLGSLSTPTPNQKKEAPNVDD